ncbi:MAG TPA: ATP-binding protein [Dongiaceae bacterium]
MIVHPPDVELLLEELAVTPDAAGQCAVLFRLVHRVWVYDLDAALEFANHARTIADSTGLGREAALARLERGRMLRMLGRYSEAEEVLKPLPERFTELGDRESVGMTIRTLSAVYMDLGLLEPALDLNREALEIFDEVANRRYYFIALMECAEVYRKRREFDEALHIINRASEQLDLMEKTDEADYASLQFKYTRSQTLLDAGRSPEAIAGALETLMIAHEIKSKNIEAGCYGILALANARLGHIDEASRCIEEFTAIGESINDPYDYTAGLLNCGRAAMAFKRLDKAHERINEALRHAAEKGIKGIVLECHRTLAEIFESAGDTATALKHFKDFYAMETELRTAGVQHRLSRMQLQLKVDQTKMETLERARQDLERIVEERTHELRVAKEQAELANRTKSDFLAHMSHELRTPLNAVIGFAELMMQEVHGTLGVPKYKEYLKDVHDSGVLLLSLINDILDVSKIEAGKQELNMEVCSVEEICVACIRLVKDRANASMVRLKVDLAPNLRRLNADMRAVKQILLNLLTNAVKFTPQGGLVTLFAADDGGRYVALGIADTGIGIAPDDLPRVLEPFGQVSNSYTRAQSGTGLGLPLAKMLTELHDGEFSIESRLGEGTTVRIRLPAAAEIETLNQPLLKTLSVN